MRFPSHSSRSFSIALRFDHTYVPIASRNCSPGGALEIHREASVTRRRMASRAFARSFSSTLDVSDAKSIARALGITNSSLIVLHASAFDRTCARDDSSLAFNHSRSATPGVRVDVRDKATGATLARVQGTDLERLNEIIARSSDAQRAWMRRTSEERGKILHRWREALDANAQDLARLMSAEQGKPLRESADEIAYASSFIQWYAEESRRAYGTVVPSSWGNARLFATTTPVGVVAAFTPWNFPTAMAARKAGAALAAGCSMIIKPSEETPLSAFALGALASEAGVPDGVLQFVVGDAKAIGERLCASEAVRKISFTGSARVGKILYKQSAETMKRVSMELGGNAPFIVCEDADVDAAASGAAKSKFRNAGQTCVAAQRFIAHESVAREFIDKLTTAARAHVIGHALNEPNATQGPMISAAHAENVHAHVRDAIAKGATLHVGGERVRGNFYLPTVLSGCTHDMMVMQEEVFGPVAAISTFRDDDDAIRVANSTSAGLASYVFTRDVNRSFKFCERLDFGIVGVNTGVISTAQAPFGGTKESGIGREGGKHGMDEYLETKYTCVGGLDEAPSRKR